MASVRVTFRPAGRDVAVAPGQSLLRAAHDHDVEITATCGGRGRCTACRVRFVGGPAPPPTVNDQVQLGPELVREGYRLACQAFVEAAATVEVSPALDERALQILEVDAAAVGQAGIVIGSGIAKRRLLVRLASEESAQTTDLETLATAADIAPDAFPLALVRDLPETLRGAEGEVTVTTFDDGVVAVERGDTTAMAFGVAIDVGTTSVVSSLLELGSGEVMASVSTLNPQATFGADLMSRIAFAQWNPGNLRTLRARIVRLLNQHVDELARRSGVLPRWIHKVTVVGNTVMHHVLLGIDPTHVGLAPYAAVARHPLVVPARDLPLKVPPETPVCFLPLVAGFVGADAVAAALATRLFESTEVRAVVDIGTNGEVIMGTRTRLLACSAPAGPALEGAQIRHGMRAAPGAIDRVWLEDGDLRLHVLGDGPPRGICGSGLIDLLAAGLAAGLVDWTGLIQVEAGDRLPGKLAARLRRRGEERILVIVPGETAGEGHEIVLTQEDVRQVQLAKAAIAAGVRLLQQVLGVPDESLTELMLAGGFGNYLSIPSALAIGLIPPFRPDRIRYVGNAAALGAQMALLSEAERETAARLARRIQHVSLAAHPAFQDLFVDAMNFPDPAGRPALSGPR